MLAVKFRGELSAAVVITSFADLLQEWSAVFVLRGGKGRARLVIMPVRDAPEWDS